MKSNPIIIRKTPGLSAGGTGRGARVAIPGVFPSASRFGEQVVKLRVPLLDMYIGGGIPIGSICVIKDEFPSKFGDMVLKSFVADGASYNHRVYIATGHVSPVKFSNELPTVKKVSNDSSSTSKSMGDEDGHVSVPDLKIAWRYGYQSPGQAATPGGMNKHSMEQHQVPFEFSKKVSAEELGGKNVHLSRICCGGDGIAGEVIDDSNASVNCKMPFSDQMERGQEILQEILDVVNDLDLESLKAPSNICRIAISHCEDEVLNGEFLLQLRSIVQNTNSCAVIIMSEAACQNQNVSSVAKCRVDHLADIVMTLQSVVEQKRRNELGGIDGVCRIGKLASNSTLKIVEPPKDIGFSFKKKRLVFHELHLPPEGENTTQRETSSSKKMSAGLLSSSSSSSCGTSIQGKRIDF